MLRGRMRRKAVYIILQASNHGKEERKKEGQGKLYSCKITNIILTNKITVYPKKVRQREIISTKS